MRSGITPSDDDHGEVPRNLPESDLASLSIKDLFAVFSISANAGKVPGIGLMLTRHCYPEKAVFGRLSPDFDRETFCRIFASGGPWDSFRDLARTVTPNYLRAKGLVEKLPKSCRYRLWPQGYAICLVFLKLFERVYAPLTAGLLQPYRAAPNFSSAKRSSIAFIKRS